MSRADEGVDAVSDRCTATHDGPCEEWLDDGLVAPCCCHLPADHQGHDHRCACGREWT